MPIHLEDYRPSDYLIPRIFLDIQLHQTHTRVRARLDVEPRTPLRPPLVLQGENLQLISAHLNTKNLQEGKDIEITEKTLILLHPPESPFTLEIDTCIDPSSNTQLMGLYRSQSTYCTQCEAEGFRKITYFLDRPDILSLYTVRIEALKQEAPVLLSNGNLLETGEAREEGYHYALWHDPHPKPCYLFALVGGHLESLTSSFLTRSGREVKLAIYVEPGKLEQATYALDALLRAMKWDEETFGREYDLDVFHIVAVSDFNMGAMENKGLNIFNDKYVLASPATATDRDYANIEAVIAHEYFHNWTGNRITCRDWFQLCLKEGLTVFRDQEFTADQRSRTVKRIEDVRTLRTHQFAEDAGPLAHPVRPRTYEEIDNFYTVTVYEKGAELIRMIQVILGKSLFRKGMDLYFERCDGTAATLEDFIACFQEVSGWDFTAFLRWYEQAGTPRVEAKGTYDAIHHNYILDFTQSTPPTKGQDHKAPMVIPIALGLLSPEGKDIVLETKNLLRQNLFLLQEPKARLIFENIQAPPTPSLLRHFSAPVHLNIDLSHQDLLNLLRHDHDPFQRWQAAQTLAMGYLRQNLAAIEAQDPLISPSDFISALGDMLSLARQAGPDTCDSAFLAHMITLPSLSSLMQEKQDNIDPDHIKTAHEGLRGMIGHALQELLEDIYARWASSAPYSPEARCAGRRALRNHALHLLAAGDPQKGKSLALAQIYQAENMTDRFAALATLSLIKGEEREQAMTWFYETYAREALVVDKWFALQAGIPEPQTLERVRHLTQHPAFSFRTPNRLYALMGTFAHANETQFHASDGSGYAFVAQIILQLHQENPQVSARLLSAFSHWAHLEPRRKALAQATLRQIAQEEDLSAPVLDILKRMGEEPSTPHH